MALKDYYNVNDDGSGGVYGEWLSEGQALAQSFTPSETYTPAAIRLKLYKGVGATSGLIVGAIFRVDGNGFPDPDVAIIDGSSFLLYHANIPEISAPGDWVTIDLGTVNEDLQAGTTYCITLLPSGFDPAIYWRQDVTSPSYSGGKAVVGVDNWDGWGNYGSPVDCMFEVYAAPGKAQNPTPIDDTEGVNIRGIDRLKKLEWDAPD